MIWGPGWPGNFPTHHVRTHFAKKSAKRETSTQNMNQPPHILCIQPNKSNQEPTIPKNSSKREKYTDSKKMCWKSDPFSELKNYFTKFICVSTLRYRYGLWLRYIGAACPHNMGSQLLILTEFGPKLSRHKKCVKRNALFSELKIVLQNLYTCQPYATDMACVCGVLGPHALAIRAPNSSYWLSLDQNCPDTKNA